MTTTMMATAVMMIQARQPPPHARAHDGGDEQRTKGNRQVQKPRWNHYQRRAGFEDW
jgi:hypothetical protein